MSGAPMAAWEMPCSPVEATRTVVTRARQADPQDAQQGLVVVDGEDAGQLRAPGPVRRSMRAG